MKITIKNVDETFKVLENIDKEKAKKIVEEICKKLLSNIVIEDYTINYK